MKLYGCLSLAAIAAITLPATATDLISQPESAVYLAPVSFSGKFSGALGDSSVENPSWFLFQLNNPQPIKAQQNTTAPGSDWSAANLTTNVTYYHAPTQGMLENTYSFTQNGANASVPLPCGQEYDLTLNTNGTPDHQTSTGGKTLSRFASSGPLSGLSNLTLQFGLNIVYESVSQTCSINYESDLMSVLLHSSSGLVVFYQVVLRDSRYVVIRNQPCGGYPMGNNYCFGESEYYVNGQQPQSVGSGRVVHTLNILSELSSAIQNQTGDADLSHWYVTGVYFGQIMQGGVVHTSRWDSLIVTAY